MGGFFKFLGGIFQPLMTLLVTIIGIAFIASVVSVQADGFIQQYVPAWSIADGAVDQVREWLGLQREERPWWRFWGS
jgi:hypothetical protein